MNTRNVEAIRRLLVDWLDVPGFAAMPSEAREVAEYLASQGCLGPASKVLTDGQAKDVTAGIDDGYFYGECDHGDHDTGDADPCTEKDILGERLERIARGETP